MFSARLVSSSMSMGLMGILVLSGLFDVLELFSYFLELFLHGDTPVRELRAAGLGTDRVHLAVHLLNKEIEAAPRAFFAVHGVSEKLCVASDPDAFSRHARLVNEERDFEFEPPRVDDLRIGQELLQTLFQPAALDRKSTRLNSSHRT